MKADSAAPDTVLEVRDVAHRFRRPGHADVIALDSVDLTVRAGEVVGVVGESGSGKTTLGLTVVGLLRPDRGTVAFQGDDLSSMARRRLRRLRSRLQIVFQDPYASLNPRMTVAQLVGEPLLVHTRMSKTERRARVKELLDAAQLPHARLDSYPHEYSGGQLQRVNIARALATRPSLLVLDEPTASLDAHTRRGVLDLLAELRRDLDLTCVLISHDLTSVHRYCDRIVVMYQGRIVEEGTQRQVADNALHPYTNKLMSARLGLDRRGDETQAFWSRASALPADTAVPHDACQYARRCPLAEVGCLRGRPLLDEAAGHPVACVRAGEIADGLAGVHAGAHPPNRSDREAN